MAVNEISGFLKYADSNGDINLFLPITTKDNVDGLDVIENELANAIKKNDFSRLIEEYFATSYPVRIAEVDLISSNWTGNASPYSQVVSIDSITPYSQVDLTPSVEQLAIFHNKDLAFVAENDDGVVTVYAIGDKPANDYKMQVTIKEVRL